MVKKFLLSHRKNAWFSTWTEHSFNGIKMATKSNWRSLCTRDAIQTSRGCRTSSFIVVARLLGGKYIFLGLMHGVLFLKYPESSLQDKEFLYRASRTITSRNFFYVYRTKVFFATRWVLMRRTSVRVSLKPSLLLPTVWDATFDNLASFYKNAGYMQKRISFGPVKIRGPLIRALLVFGNG